jgi:hypothetical protein
MSHKCFPSFQEFSSFQEGARRFEKAMRGIPDRVPMCAQMHEFAKQVSFLFLPLAIVLLSANVIANNYVCLFGIIWKKKIGRK